MPEVQVLTEEQAEAWAAIEKAAKELVFGEGFAVVAAGKRLTALVEEATARAIPMANLEYKKDMVGSKTPHRGCMLGKNAARSTWTYTPELQADIDTLDTRKKVEQVDGSATKVAGKLDSNKNALFRLSVVERLTLPG